MSNVIDSVVSGADEHATLDVASALSAEPALLLEVISDAICPWCWIGKHRLDRAIAALTPDIAVHVTWRPFELNPGSGRHDQIRAPLLERRLEFAAHELGQCLGWNQIVPAGGMMPVAAIAGHAAANPETDYRRAHYRLCRLRALWPGNPQLECASAGGQ